MSKDGVDLNILKLFVITTLITNFDFKQNIYYTLD